MPAPEEMQQAFADTGAFTYRGVCAWPLARLRLAIEMSGADDALRFQHFAADAAEFAEAFGHRGEIGIPLAALGGRVALAILSVLSPAEIQHAIAAKDAASVARANGVGPKLAARIINELKDKAGAMPAAPGVAMAAPAPATN